MILNQNSFLFCFVAYVAMDSKFVLHLASVTTYDSVQCMEIVRKITNCLQNFKRLIPASLFNFL